MRRRDFLRCAAAAAAGYAMSGAAHAADRAKPNIVFFLVDDMGWQDTSVPFWTEATPFNRHFRTPNMERLAASGTLFTDAYSHPVCTPTRTAWMTGQSPIRTHITNWTFEVDKDTARDWGGFKSPAWRREGIQPHDLTLPKILREAGYRTIHCGKAHFGGYMTPGSDPRNLGFDVNIAGTAAGAPNSYQGQDNYGNRRKGAFTEPKSVPMLEAYHGTDTHLTDALTIEVKKAIDAAVDDGKPFFLNMALYAVHTPVQPNEQFMGNYTNRNYAGTDIDIPEKEEQYASMVEGMDKALGALLDHVNARGVAENTLFIFTSDNGGLTTERSRETTPHGTDTQTHNLPLRSGKASGYEGGIRVPFIVSWAKRAEGAAAQRALPIAAGGRSAQPLIVEDIFPTVAAIAGAEGLIPAGYTFDGVDCRAYYTGAASDPERPLRFHYPHGWSAQVPEHEAHSEMRVGDWKIIYWYYRDAWELYNLADDIGERNNLAAKEPERLRAMAQRLVAGYDAMGAQWPIKLATGEAFKPPIPG